MRVTFSQAFRSIKDLFVKKQAPVTVDTVRLTPIDMSVEKCSKCGFPIMSHVTNMDSDIISVAIFKCEKCGFVLEKQYRKDDNVILKTISTYNEISPDYGEISEVITNRSYKSFNIDRLWLVCGRMCYPALIRTRREESIVLMFIPYPCDITKEDVQGYIITDQNILAYASFSKHNNKPSYMVNPYLLKLPHQSLSYSSFPNERNDDLATIGKIRFMHMIRDDNSGAVLHDLIIMKDIPMLLYGIEIHVRFLLSGYPEHIKISELIDIIDLKNILCENTILTTRDGCFIKAHRVRKITCYSAGPYKMNEDDSTLFVDEVKKFFDVSGE